MHAICYLQKDMTFDFYIGDFGFQKGPLSHFYYVMKCMATFFCVNVITSSQQQWAGSLCCWDNLVHKDITNTKFTHISES